MLRLLKPLPTLQQHMSVRRVQSCVNKLDNTKTNTGLPQPSEQGEAMTDEELKQAIEELNDTKAEKLTYEEFAALAEVYGKKETEQDIATLEKNIALMREERDIATLEKNIALMREEELRVCVKEFFDKYLNRTEESSGGKMFNPIVVSCCRVMMTEPLNNLLARMAELSGAKPKESYD
jgi:predicted Zn-dependent peptidase